MKLKNFLNEYFTYNTKEKYSIIVLLFLLLIAFVIPKFLFHTQTEHWAIDSLKINQLNNLVNTFPKVKVLKLFSFNPNTISPIKLKQLGLSEKQISNIINYRKKGLVFKTKEDFKKLYTITSQEYKELNKYIRIPIPKSRNKKILYSYNLNKLSFKQCKLLGFSNEISRRVIAYLKTGARFKDIQDLKKIYGFDDATFNKIENQIYTHTENQKISHKQTLLSIFDPNTASIDKLQKNGISYIISKRIHKYISKGFLFKKKTDLKKIYGFDTLLYNKLEKYIEIHIPKITPLNINEINLNDFLKSQILRTSIANRLIKYRNLLGGFYSEKQYQEIYGINKNEIEQLSENYFININTIKKHNILKSSPSIMTKHPYIDYNTADDIVNKARKIKAKYIKIFLKNKMKGKEENILKMKIEIRKFLSDSISQRIIPYLDIGY